VEQDHRGPGVGRTDDARDQSCEVEAGLVHTRNLRQPDRLVLRPRLRDHVVLDAGIHF
jgi:hypothetical protein